MELPLQREDGSDHYWSLPLYWGVIVLPLTLSPVTFSCLQIIQNIKRVHAQLDEYSECD